jgi:SAM-dependent methyltransferase
LIYNFGVDYKAMVKAGYNKIASRYLEERTRDSEDVRLLKELTDRLPVHANVLDAGCGAGIPVAELLSQKFNVTGVDFSEAQIERARKNVPNAEFICRDMTKLAFADGSYDAICSYYAIIHIPREEHQPLLIDFYRILKPDGLSLLCLGAENLVDDIDDNFFGTRMYWSHFDRETYLAMLEEIGFRIIWSKYVTDPGDKGAGHLFVLTQKPSP